MKLSKVKLHNYRCFGADEQVISIDDVTAYIGNNSTGKTAALSAINCMFSSNGSDRVLKRSDFHLPKEINPDDVDRLELYVEAVFTFEELNDELEESSSVPIFFQRLVVDEPQGNPYLRIRLEATWEKSSTIEGAIESHIYYINCPETESTIEEHKIPAIRRDLDRIRVVYVPAVRDPSKQLKNASGSMLYQIMSSINWSDTVKDSVKEKIEEINNKFLEEKGISLLGDSICSQWKSYDCDQRFSDAKLRFNSTDIDSCLKKSEVVFLPTPTGKESTVADLSDGLRSLFYISLVDSLLDIENKIQTEQQNESFSYKPPILTIIALEEPENHIAPHLIGNLISNIERLSSRSNAQTILTSHSTAIIKRIDPENIRYFRLNNTDFTTEVHTITLPDKERLSDQYKYIKEAVRAYPELYFAKLVILGEGDSEEIILPRLWTAKNGNIDTSGISIVPLGGRHVNHFWRLLNDLNIPHITLLDLDKERYGGGWGRIKYALEQLIQNGYDKNKLLITKKGVLSDQELESMNSRDISNNSLLQSWIGRLEKYHVFFSAPLDIDFLMLEHYTDIYKGLIRNNDGPYIMVEENGENQRRTIVDIEKAGIVFPEYQKRVEDDVHHTLKECGGDGKTYSDEQKKLMIWYTYFFLNRGKPSTHIEALSRIDDKTLSETMPSIFERLFADAEKQLKGEQT